MAGTDTYLFAGGGSGGHLFPGIAVADELRRRSPAARCVFVGSERPVERVILQPTGYEHHALPVESLQELRRRPARFLLRTWSALRSARRILLTERPRRVIGLGGFASVPTVWSARRLGIPVLLIEQNVIPGAATRWLAGCARQICLSYEETQGRLRPGLPSVITGNPVRSDILHAASRRLMRPAAGNGQLKTLLILGGSQGAESLNAAVVHWASNGCSQLADWRIVHQTGPGRAADIRAQYEALGLSAVVEEFFPNVAEWYVAADLAISRAGATTLAELACVGCPSVLIPYPFAADQHQAANADVFVRHGAALAISQAAAPAETASRLGEALPPLLVDPRRRELMRQSALRLARPDAARNIVDLMVYESRPINSRCETASPEGTISRPAHFEELVK